MRELNKTKVYDLSDLTSEELNEIITCLDFKPIDPNNFNPLYIAHNGYAWVFFKKLEISLNIANAKELFYTLEDVQVDCRELSEEQIKQMADVFEKNGYKTWEDDTALNVSDVNYLLEFTGSEVFVSIGSEEKTTITYSKFMELFTDVTTDNPQPHYDNTNGSIYKFCNDQKLNAWEFDIIKRVVRCRKKGLFKEDLQKTKDLIDLYLKEFTDEK